MTGATTRNALLALAALALFTVAAWFALGPGKAPPEIDQATVYEPAPKDQRSSLHIDASPAGEDPPGSTQCRVDLTMATVARALPDRLARATCVLVSSLKSTNQQGIAGVWVAGLAALPLAREVQGQQLVRFRLGNGSDHYRVTRLRADDRGTIQLLRGRMTITSGKVLDEAGGPVRDARVWLAGYATTTDKDGCFSIEAMPAESGLPLVVRKRGFASLYRVLSGAQYEALSKQPIVLRPGVELHVRFTAKVAAADSQFFLLPAGGRDTRLLAHPFFFAAVEPVHELRDDTLVFDGLPPGARVRVRMQRPGFAPSTSEELRLDRDVVGAVVQGEVRARVTGTVVDSSGKPVPNVWLTTRAGDAGLSLGDTGWLLPPGAYVADGAVDQSSASGEFALSRLHDRKGRTVLAMESEGRTGLAYTLTGAGDQAVDVRVFESRPDGEPQIRLQAGAGLPAVVRLTVHDESGDHGPYTWRTDSPFPVGVSRPSLLRISVRVDGLAGHGNAPVVHEDVLVVGHTELSVAR